MPDKKRKKYSNSNRKTDKTIFHNFKRLLQLPEIASDLTVQI